MIEVHPSPEAFRVADVLAYVRRWPERGFMESFAGHVLLRIDAGFDRKEDVHGHTWRQWSDSYRKSGAPFHAMHTLLELSGDMRASMEIENVSDHKVTIGSDVPYAAYQNAMREFAGFRDEDPRDAYWAEDWFREVLK